MKKKTTLLATVGVLFICCGFSVNAEENILTGKLTPKDIVEYLETEEEADLYDFFQSELMTPCEEAYYDYWECYTDLGEVSDYSNIQNVIDAICENALLQNYDVGFKITDEMHLEVYVTMHSDDELVTQEEISEILLQANYELNGLNNWNEMQLSNLDADYFDEIICAIEGEEADADLFDFQIVWIEESADEERFSVCFKPRGYLVSKGDTLTKIAKEKLTTVEELLQLNPEIEDANSILTGDIIRIN